MCINSTYTQTHAIPKLERASREEEGLRLRMSRHRPPAPHHRHAGAQSAEESAAKCAFLFARKPRPFLLSEVREARVGGGMKREERQCAFGYNRKAEQAVVYYLDTVQALCVCVLLPIATSSFFLVHIVPLVCVFFCLFLPSPPSSLLVSPFACPSQSLGKLTPQTEG